MLTSKQQTQKTAAIPETDLTTAVEASIQANTHTNTETSITKAQASTGSAHHNHFESINTERKRRNTIIKWSRYSENVLPAWIAEHDFTPPEEVNKALLAIIENRAYGYYDIHRYHKIENKAKTAFAGWAKRRYGWDTDTELIDTQVGALVSVTAITTAFAAPGEGIILTPPIYNNFFRICPTSKRKQMQWPMRYDAKSGWHLDPDDLETLLRKESDARVLLWCNPHNPTGQVANKSTMERIIELAHTYDIYVVSDEIHADILYEPDSFIPMLSIPGAAERVMSVASPGKTFALSGMDCSLTVYGNTDLRKRVQNAHPLLMLKHSSRMGLEAAAAAWDHGDKWADACVATLKARRDHLKARLTQKAPNVKFHPPSGTFLAWLDVSAYGLGPTPANHILTHSQVALAEGTDYGEAGKGHVRLNFGTSQNVLDEIIDRIVSCLNATS